MTAPALRTLSRDRAPARNGVLAALDIGCSKITCIIGRRGDASDGRPRIDGVGVQSTKAMRAGAVVDLQGLERAIRLAVEQAERDAETRIKDVVVGVSGPELKGEIVHARLDLGGRPITQIHMREARDAAIERFDSAGRAVLHMTPLGYTVDHATGVRDPSGMFAESLTANLFVASAPGPGLRNILQCIAKAHLEPIGIAAAPFASALSVLVEDEAEQGVTVIDMGGGVTSAACFHDERLIHLDVMGVGGSRVTADLAEGLGSTMAAAERVKMLHGAVDLAEVDPLDTVEAPRLGGDGRLQSATCTRADLVRFLRPRVEEIFELMDARLSRASAAGRPLPRRIVLTGGASQLIGIERLAEDVFRAPVRVAQPVKARGLGETYSSPAFAASAGLLVFAASGHSETARAGAAPVNGENGASVLRRVTGWLQENF
ncbi:cell division protein FtsA [bacterium]|nr:cell division protein FtsA [bacterium]